MLTLTASVTAIAPGAGTPTDLVTFFDGTTVLGTATLDSSGTTVFSTSALGVGSHSITVSFSGDTNFVASTSSPLIVLVSTSGTQASVTTSNATSAWGESIDLVATIVATANGAGTPAGIVTFKDGDTILGTATLDGDGVATLTTFALSVGTHLITVIFAGNSDFAASTSATVTQTVSQAQTAATVTLSATPAALGTSIVISVHVLAVTPGEGTPTGVITFFDGTVSIGTATLDSSGKATLSLSNFSAGAHVLTARFAGDTHFVACTAVATTLNVLKGETLGEASLSTSKSNFGEEVTITATIVAGVFGTPSGRVTFFDGSTSICSAILDASGVARFTISTLGVGSHSITVVYEGDHNFDPTTSPATTFTVDAVIEVTPPVPPVIAISQDPFLPVYVAPFVSRSSVFISDGLTQLRSTPIEITVPLLAVNRAAVCDRSSSLAGVAREPERRTSDGAKRQRNDRRSRPDGFTWCDRRSTRREEGWRKRCHANDAAHSAPGTCRAGTCCAT